MINLTQTPKGLLITLYDKEELTDLIERGGGIADALDAAGYLGNDVHEPQEGWLGMTEAPCISFGAVYGDEDEDSVTYDAAYYYGDYMILDWRQELLGSGRVVFKEAPQTIDTHDEDNPIPKISQQWFPYPADVAKGLLHATQPSGWDWLGFGGAKIVPNFGDWYEITDGRVVKALERRMLPENYHMRGKLGSTPLEGVAHLRYKGRLFFKAKTSTGVSWWGYRNK